MPGLDALVAASGQGALFALLAWGLGRLFPRLPARYRAALWWAVSLKMALAVLAPSALALPLLPPKAAPAASPTSPSPAVTGISEEATPPPAAPNRGPLTETILRVVWLAGAGVLFAAHLRQGGRLRAVLRRTERVEIAAAPRLAFALGLQRVPEVRLSDEIGSPLVARAWRPVVLLPARFLRESAPAEVEMALAHEFAHVRSRDLFLAFVPALAQTLLWFHPAAWLAAREWTAEREADCDALALHATGGSPAAYGELLVRVAESGRPAFAAPASMGAASAYPTLRRRLERMKTNPFRPSRALRAAGLAVASLALIAALPWAVTAQTPAKSPKRVASLSGTWTATKPVYDMKMQYTFKPDGSYLALIGEMDHQGDYRIEGRRVVLLPRVVAQRETSVYLAELAKNPDGLPPAELASMKRLAKPYALSLSADGKTLAGLGFTARFDPKAKPLF